MRGAPHATIDPLVVCWHLRRLVELRVVREERIRVFRPRLVPQAIEQRNQPDAILPTRGGQFPSLRRRDAMTLQFGARAELEAVVHFQNQHVETHGTQDIRDEPLSQGHFVGAGADQVHRPPRRVLLSPCLEPLRVARRGRCVLSGGGSDHADEQGEPPHVAAEQPGRKSGPHVEPPWGGMCVLPADQSLTLASQ